MPAGTVLSSPQAHQAIAQMQNIINGGLLEQINQLATQGNTLCEPQVWDGNLAASFRGEWPATCQKLNTMQQDLEALRVQVQKINANIMAAGGNA